MGSILRPTKIANIADFFHHLCDAITDVIFFMCIDAILFEKNNVRFDAISIAMRLPPLIFSSVRNQTQVYRLIPNVYLLEHLRGWQFIININNITSVERISSITEW